MAIVKLKKVRLSFPSLFEKDKHGRFSVALLLEKDGENHKKVAQAIQDAAEEKWKEKAPQLLKAAKASAQNICLRDGNLKPEYEGFPGAMFVSAANKIRPKVYDKDGFEVPEDDGRVYAGCYVHAIIDVYAFKHENSGYQINASLRGIKFVADGDAFAGGGLAAAEDFENMDVEDEDNGFI